MAEEVTLIKLEPPEKHRTYFFPKGEKVVIHDVTHFVARPSGTHRLKTKDGFLHIVSSGWNHIEINVEKFTV